MKILGIDPGTLRTGAGFIQADGNRYRFLHFEVIKADSSLALFQRLKIIFEGIDQLLAHFQPDVLALEDVFFGRDVKAMVKIGEARACAMLAAAKHGIEVVEYPPARVKQSVCGNGRATKDQIQKMIQRLLNLTELPASDGADALAIAICHVHSRGVRRLAEQVSKQRLTY